MNKALQTLFLIADEVLVLVGLWLLAMFLNVSIPVWFWLVVAPALLLVSIVVYRSLTVTRTRPKTGPESLIGKQGTAQTDLTPRGFVNVEGEMWTAESEGLVVRRGQRVTVRGLRGLTLLVEPEEEPG